MPVCRSALSNYLLPMRKQFLYSLLVCLFLTAAARAQLPQYNHIVVVIFENHSYSEIIGNPSAATFNNLAANGALFAPAAADPAGLRSGSHALRHPSQPNYLELYSGDNEMVLQDGRPGTSAEPLSSPPPFNVPNLGANLRNASHSFATFSETLPSVGYDGDSYTTVAGQNQYERKHNPVTNWIKPNNPTVNQLPPSVNRPFTDFQAMATTKNGFAKLPTVSFVVPNEQNDMHDGTIAQADTWLKTNIVDTYLAWASTHNSLLIVTFDENDDEQASFDNTANLIPTIFAGAKIKPGRYSETDINASNPYLGNSTDPGVQTPTGTAMNHWNVLATLEAIYGLPAIGGSAGRPPITDVFTNTSKLPNPASSGVDHIIVVMMENRSFDHYLGWLSGANGRQSGLTYTDNSGVRNSTYALAVNDSSGDFQGCGLEDPNHSFEGGRVEFNLGKCNGWRRDGANPADNFSIGYYPAPTFDFFAPAATDWTVCDNYFAGIMAETYPNRFHMHAAATDRLHNAMHPSGSGSDAPAPSNLPTIWDLLAQRGISARYYYGDTPFTALWGAKYLNISFPFSQFLVDARTGRLPHVCFVDPRFQDESSGTSNDDHPHADIRAGEYFLDQIYNAVTSSPNWNSTVLIVNYDEWGGFFDHVAPPVAPVPPATRSAGEAEELNVNDPYFGLLGFRIPNLIISPLARRGYVSHERFDHTSVLKFIEWRFGLPSLTIRDRVANNIADALNFGHPNANFRTYSVPPVVSAPCLPSGTGTSAENEWQALRVYATSLGFPTP
jgi:phospholipase C